MKVYVVIEWEGNSQVVDGMTIRGIFRSYEAAVHELQALSVATTQLIQHLEIQEHQLS